MQQRLISVSLMDGRRSNDTVGTRLLYSLARYITMSINGDDLDICIINFHGIIIKLYWKCQSAEGDITVKSMGKVYQSSSSPGGSPIQAATWRGAPSSQSSSSPGWGPARRYPCPVVNSWAGLCTWLTRRPRPCGSGGSTGDPAKKTRAGHQGTKESAGGAQGRRRREGAVEEIFHFHWKVKVTPTLSLLLFSWYFCQCLKRAWGRKYSQ